MVFFRHSQCPQVCLTVPSGEEAEVKRWSDGNGVSEEGVVSTLRTMDYVHRKQMPWMGLPYHGFGSTATVHRFRVTYSWSRPVEPRRDLRHNEASNEKVFEHLDGGRTCLKRSPHAATMSLNHAPCPRMSHFTYGGSRKSRIRHISLVQGHSGPISPRFAGVTHSFPY